MRRSPARPALLAISCLCACFEQTSGSDDAGDGDEAGDETTGGGETTSPGSETGAESTGADEGETTGTTGTTGESTETGTPPGECGDGTVDPDEECDLGEANADDAECTTLCRMAICGDDLIWTAMESCDDGNDDNGDGCSDECLLESCGNGVEDEGEACDDGNSEEDDECTSLCQPPECGDGFVQPSHGEDCDDGDSDNLDECPNDCADPVCGDDVREGGEECDQGADNGNGNTSCTATCLLNVCGDGYLYVNQEQCDEGADNGDGVSTCTEACALNACGDGYLLGAVEDCDDENLVRGDGCNDYCDDENLEIIQVDAGDNHTCALFENGRVRCWGYNYYRQLGHPEIPSDEWIGDDEAPVSARDVDVGGPVAEIGLGSNHTCARLESGGVRCWGYNYDGELGQGNTDLLTEDMTPAAVGDVPLGDERAIDLAVGAYHTCVVLEQGGVRCWGYYGGDGRLGYGPDGENIGDDETPTDDLPFAEAALVIAAGDAHTCALFEAGSIRCWGYGYYGQLGLGTGAPGPNMGDDETLEMLGGLSTPEPVVDLVAGAYFGCVRSSLGGVHCWGNGYSGQLGLGTGAPGPYVGDDEPLATIAAVAVGSAVSAVGAGSSHACVVMEENGTVRCFGNNGSGQLGLGNTTPIGDDEAPSATFTVPLDVAARAVVGGANHTCALTTAGRVRCWGYGIYGQLGYGNDDTIGDTEPASVGDVPVL